MKIISVGILLLMTLSAITSFRVVEGCGCKKRHVYKPAYAVHRHAVKHFRPKMSCEARVCKLKARIAELENTVEEQQMKIQYLKDHCHCKRRSCHKPKSWKKESCGCPKKDVAWGNDAEWGFGDDSNRAPRKVAKVRAHKHHYVAPHHHYVAPKHHYVAPHHHYVAPHHHHAGHGHVHVGESA